MIGFSFLWWVLLFSSIVRKGYYFLFVCLLFVLSLIVGFRGMEVGADTQTYALIYENVNIYKEYSYPEPLWVLLNFVVYSLGGSFHLLLWLSSLITFICLAKVIKKYSPNILFSIFILYSLYFVFYSMNIVRQVIAVSFALYAYMYLIENRNKLFFVYAFVAFLFHYTAIVAFFILLIKKMAVTYRKLYWGIFFSLLGGLFVINETLLEHILGPYAFYLSSSENGFRTSMFLPILLSVFLNVLCVYLYWSSKIEVRESLWFKIYIVGILVNNLLMRLELGTRVVMFFSIVQIILLPMYVYNNRIKSKPMSLFILLGYVASLFFMLLLTGSVGIYPYNNVLFD